MTSPTFNFTLVLYTKQEKNPEKMFKIRVSGSFLLQTIEKLKNNQLMLQILSDFNVLLLFSFDKSLSFSCRIFMTSLNMWIVLKVHFYLRICIFPTLFDKEINYTVSRYQLVIMTQIWCFLIIRGNLTPLFSCIYRNFCLLTWSNTVEKREIACFKHFLFSLLFFFSLRLNKNKHTWTRFIFLNL